MSIIARDTNTVISLSGTTALSTTYTCSGVNRLLIIMATSTSTDWTGFTYGGVALTQIQTGQTATNRISLWYLVNPASGSNTLTGTWPGNQTHGVIVSSYTGVNQSTPINTSTAGTGSGTSLTQSVTTNVDQCWAVYAGATGGASAITADTNSTLVGISSTNFEALFDTQGHGDITPAGSFSMTFDGASASKAGIMAALAPISVASLFWVGGTGTWDNSTATHWASSSGGGGGAAVPQASTTAFFDGNSGGGTVTVGATISITAITGTGFTGTLTQSNPLTLSGNLLEGNSMSHAVSAALVVGGNVTMGTSTGFSGSSAMTIGGNLTLTSGMTYTYSGAMTFNSTSSGKTITTAGKSITGATTFNGVGGGWTFQDNFTSSSTLTITNGSVNFNGKNVTFTTTSNAGTLTTGNGALTFGAFTNTGTLTLGSGTSSYTSFTTSGSASLGSNTLTLTGTGTVWNASGTVTPSTSTIKLTNASASSKTFAGGSLTYNNLWITGSGSGAYTITGSNTFNDFKVDTPPHTVNFTASTTTSVQSFTVSGTAGNLMTLQSTSPGTQWKIYKSTTGNVVCDYLSLQDSFAEHI